MTPLPRLRWWICGLLFLSTVINYIDRQTLSVLAPYLKVEFNWTNTDFALIVIAFRVAYAFGQTASGRALDKLGTRKGLLLSVSWYSLASMITSLAVGLKSFAVFRFLLGLGESANWPGAAKAVSEWFPKNERGWAVAIYDSGSSVGGAVAPFLVIWLHQTFDSWRPAFLIVGSLGALWLLAWSRLYHPPTTHPWLTPEQRSAIAVMHEEERQTEMQAIQTPEQGSEQVKPTMGRLLSLRTTWGIILGKSLTDPVWFFITDWFAIYLVSKGFRLENTLIGFWVPFLAADLGNFFGGGFSSYLIKRGWNVVDARKFVILITGLGMALLAPAAFTSNFVALIGLFALSTFSYAAFSTMCLALPADLYPSSTVASVSGMSGTGAGIGTIVSTFLIGWVSDRYSFGPILVVASMVPLVATALVFLLVRRKSQPAVS